MTQTLSIFVFVLFWINLSVSSVNIYFSIKIYKNDVYSSSLRGTKERLLEINPNYFLEKEIENPKELRNLSNDKIRLSILIINACSFYFILMLSFSFCTTKDECCSEQGICFYGCCICCHGCCTGDCSCFWKRNREDVDEDGKPNTLLGVFILLIIFVGLFYVVKACGVALSRIFSLIILFLIHVTLAVLSLYSGFDKFCILLASFSSFAALCDLIMFILISCLLCFNCLASDNQNPHSQQAQKLQLVQPNTSTPYDSPY